MENKNNSRNELLKCYRDMLFESIENNTSMNTGKLFEIIIFLIDCIVVKDQERVEEPEQDKTEDEIYIEKVIDRYGIEFKNLNIIAFKKDLEKLINNYSLENLCNTPDFIIAECLFNCFKGLIHFSQDRDRWYNFQPWENSKPLTGKETKDD